MIEIVVFVCGAVVMILEMAGSRILAPFLGTSIVVWTSLIGVILGSLSLGYWWGGKLADRDPSYRTLSFIILISAFFIALVALSKSIVLEVLQEYAGGVHLGSTAATLALFAPPSVLLGMVSPYAVRLKMSDLQTSGRTVGNLYAISTVGSIFGTFLAGFVLIAYFGSTNILFVLSIVLCAASSAAYTGGRIVKSAATILFITLFILSNSFDRYMAEQEFHDFDTAYNRVLVYTSEDARTARPMRVMVTNPRGKQSGMFLDDSVELAVAYTRYYKLASHFRPDMKKVLMLGGGGYSFPKYAMVRYPDVRMDVVEIDPEVTAIARRFFALEDNERLRILHEDARTFINKMKEKYDVVLGDTFNSHYSIPFHLTTVEAVRRIHDLLDDRGVVIANILASMDGASARFLRAEYATFKEVFPRVYLFPMNPDNLGGWQNIMLVAFKSDAEPSWESADPEIEGLLEHLWKNPIPRDCPPLTDDFAPVDRYIAAWK